MEVDDDEVCTICTGVLQQCIFCGEDYCPNCSTGGDECPDCLNGSMISLALTEAIGEEEAEARLI